MNKLEKNFFDSNNLESIAQTILHEAALLGASQTEVAIALNKGFSVSAHDGDVETVEYHQDKVVDIHVYINQRAGTASISDLRPEAIQAAVRAACHIAKFTDPDPYAGLAQKSELALTLPAIEMGYAWSLSVPAAIELACLCEREAKAYDKRIMNAEQASVVTSEALNLYANSNGFLGTFPYSRHEISCVLVAKDEDEMERGYHYTTATTPEALETVQQVATQAAQRTISRLGARRLPTMKAPVIFIAEEARSLLGLFASAISGGSLYRKASFLVDHLGKKIFSDFIHIQEHPYIPFALGSAPFDDNGVATRENIFVEAGILTNYALGVYAARKLGMQTTGNAGGMHNLTLQGGNKNLAALIKTMHKGLLITEMMGNGISLLTGDYSRGAGGFWVENGEIQYPVHEITVAGKLQEMFTRILEVGNDIDTRGNIRTGSILIEEMMIAGE